MRFICPSFLTFEKQVLTNMKLHVTNESAPLETVVLGIGTEIGPPIGINPMMRYHIKNGTYPNDEIIQAEIATLEAVLKANGVQLLRPKNIKNLDQIFMRDIGFVIDNYFVVANMKEESRKPEIQGIQYLLEEIGVENIIRLPEEATVEGGDVVLWNEHVFVGLGARSNVAAVKFLQEKFPHKKVHGLELLVNEKDRHTHTLHLDCVFQPIGTDEAIFYEAGFAKRPNSILDLFPEEKLIRVTQEQKVRMFPNIFSISPTKIIVERSFTELKTELHRRGYETFDVDYKETSKASGLLRCSTLPLYRKA